MYVYVIASSPEGPSKIGKAIVPTDRRSALQTGAAEQLKIEYQQFVGPAAGAIESWAKRELAPHRREGAGDEWFDVPVWMARWSLERARLVVSAQVTPRESLLQLRNDLRSINLLPDHADVHLDSDDEESHSKFTDELRPKWIDPFELLVINKITNHLDIPRFSDFFRSFDYGRAFSRYIARSNSPFAWTDHYDPYVKINSLVEARPFFRGPCINMIRLMWTEARFLTATEKEILKAIWNEYAPKASRVWSDGPQWGKAGIDDTVSGIRVFAYLEGLEYNGDIVFKGKNFEAVLSPVSRNAIYGGNYDLQPLPPRAALTGWIYPIYPADFETLPFEECVLETRKMASLEFCDFISRTDHVYPCQRQYDGPPETACFVKLRTDLFDLEDADG